MMENYNNIEMSGGGLQCDNPNCDYHDTTIKIDETCVGKPCPKCGENLLTEDDYVSYMQFEDSINMINSVSPEFLESMMKDVDMDKIKETEFFKDAEGLENLDSDGLLSFLVSGRNGIKVEKIEKIDDKDDTKRDC